MIASVHARAARDAGATISGVLGSSPHRSRAWADSWGAERAYSSFEELVRDRPAVVHICTPNASHYRYAKQSLLAGMHVVCEKPLATDPAQAEELAELARDSGLVAAVPFVYRFHPLIREIRARRARGDFGALHLVHGSYLQDWLLAPGSSSWRVQAAHGGPSRAFADIGSHWCDLVEFVTGERLSEVVAAVDIAYPTRPVPSATSFTTAEESADVIPVDTEDSATAMFRTDAGTLVSLAVSQVAAGHKNRLWFELDGAGGSVAFDQENSDRIVLGSESGQLVLRRGEGELADEQARLNRVPAGHGQGYPDAFASFVGDVYAAIRGRPAEGLPTFEDGARSVLLVDAVLRSIASKSWTSVTPVAPLKVM